MSHGPSRGCGSLSDQRKSVLSAGSAVSLFGRYVSGCAAAMVHELFLRKYGLEHLRKLARVGITIKRSKRRGSKAGRERACSAGQRWQESGESFRVSGHLKKKPPIALGRTLGAGFGNLEFLKGFKRPQFRSFNLDFCLSERGEAARRNRAIARDPVIG